MKMIYAGLTTSPNAIPQNFLYNCTRNASCQPRYLVPIRSLADLMLYVEFPFGKPTSVFFNLVDCSGVPTEVIFCNYVIGQKPDGGWYGVFTGAAPTELSGDEFYLQGIFSSISGFQYKYFSEYISFDQCDPLTRMNACYPDEPAAAQAFDCNGIYYGYHAGAGESLGNALLRYYHWAFVRKGKVIERNTKMTFNLFKSRRAYRNEISSSAVFEFERVPTFYKNIIIGILSRGNIEIDGKEYVLDEEQEFSVSTNEEQMWAMDPVLTDICKQYFGCNESNCVPAPPPCTGNYTNAEIISNGFILSNGFLAGGESIDWELYIGEFLVDSGNTSTNTGIFTYTLDEETECYDFIWRKRCNCSIEPYFSNQYTLRFGACGCCTPTLVTADAETIPPQQTALNLQSSVLCDSYIGPDQGGVSGGGQLKYHRIKFALAQAYSTDVVLDLAMYYSNPPGSLYSSLAFGTEILPDGHYAKSAQFLSFTKAFRFTIPAGSLEYTTDSLRFYQPDNAYSDTPPCRDNRNNYPYTGEAFFVKVVSPVNNLQLTFLPVTGTNGYPTTFEQIV